MKALIALTVLVAAAVPASAGSDPVSPMEALSTIHCHPAIIGIVTGVHTDPTHFGTDVVLDGNVMGFIPTDHEKYFATIDSYVGQRVAIWGASPGIGNARGRDGLTRGVEMVRPGELMLLSTALADPKKTACFSVRQG